MIMNDSREGNERERIDKLNKEESTMPRGFEEKVEVKESMSLDDVGAKIDRLADLLTELIKVMKGDEQDMEIEETIETGGDE